MIKHDKQRCLMCQKLIKRHIKTTLLIRCFKNNLKKLRQSVVDSFSIEITLNKYYKTMVIFHPSQLC